MSREDKSINELSYLILLSLEGEISKTQFDRLQQLLRADPQARYAYHKLINVYLSVCDPENLMAMKGEKPQCIQNPTLLEAIAKADQDLAASLADHDTIDQVRQRAERQLHAFLAEQDQLRRFQERSIPVKTFDISFFLRQGMHRIERMFQFLVKATVGLAAVSLVLISLLGIFHHLHSQRVVAILGDTSHAQWDLAPDSNELRLGRLRLESGYARISMKRGADVLLQAPCAIELQSENQLFLENGTLYANVSPGVKGFTVETSISKIIDFGTEFGAQVGRDDNVEVHVFKGNVGVGVRTAKAYGLRNVSAGKAAVMDAHNNIQVYTLAERSKLFVRSLPTANPLGIPGKRVDLADIVGGGNGFGTGRLGDAIDLNSGLTMHYQHDFPVTIAKGYTLLPRLRFIDGVFIPDGEDTGRVVVSSTGLVFTGCPDTLGSHIGYLSNGAVFQQTGQAAVHPGQLRGRTYVTQEFPSIGMHANAGITFDLAALRELFMNRRIVRFSSLCGISETVVSYIQENDMGLDDLGATEFWVLVDGEIRFHRILMANPAESAAIAVDLAPSARFLTLMTTDTQGYNYFCWGMFAQPALELDKP